MFYYQFVKYLTWVGAVATMACPGGSIEGQSLGPITIPGYSGPDGSLTYVWNPPPVGWAGTLGAIHVTARLNGTQQDFDFSLHFAQAPRDFRFQSVAAGPASGQYSFHFVDGSTPLTITAQPVVTNKTLTVDLAADKPLLADIAGDVFPAALTGTAVPIPYYGSSVQFYPGPKLFSNAYFDWQYSSGTENNVIQAAYKPLTNGSRLLMKDRAVFSLSEKLGEVLPRVNNPASPYLSQLAGRTVLDIWDGYEFRRIADSIAAIGDAGVQNCAIILHSWQGNGFDNQLPATYPANAARGGNADLSSAIATGKSLGCFVAVHENYNDIYPNYSGFNNSLLGLNSDGSPITGWFNPDTGIQAGVPKQSVILSNAKQWSPMIHSGLGTNAGYIDVMSASVPDIHVDMDATQSGAGNLTTVVNTSKAVWTLERQTHAGPVFGEGQYHWYWSGLLDGVEAQWGAANLVSQGESNALFVDFDLQTMHPLQVNHGMGLYGRWLVNGENITRTDLSDAYRMQEVAFGHAPYISGELWNIPARTLLEQNLVSPVAARYGTQTATNIQYQVNGQWVDATGAVAANNWSRVQVQYANGDTITANGQPGALTVSGRQLPQYGWIATGPQLVAYTALVNGQIADFVQTPTYLFANARNQADLVNSGFAAQAGAGNFQATGNRTFQFDMQWKVLDGAQGRLLTPFVHFTDAAGNGIFPGDYSLAVSTSQWQPGKTYSDSVGVTIPASVSDGTYLVRVGLYSPQTSLRVPTVGADVSLSSTIGTLIVSQNGRAVSFQPTAPPTFTPDSRLNSGGSVVDFTAVRTDGMVWLTQNNGAYTARTYPRSRNVVVELNADQFHVPASVVCDGVALPAPSVTGNYWSLPISGAKSCTW